MNKSILHKCKNCGYAFTPKRKWQVFCGDKCRNNYHKLKYEELIKKSRVYNPD